MKGIHTPRPITKIWSREVWVYSTSHALIPIFYYKLSKRRVKPKAQKEKKKEKIHH